MANPFHTFKKWINRFSYNSFQTVVKNNDMLTRVSQKTVVLNEGVFDQVNLFKYPTWTLKAFAGDLTTCSTCVRIAVARCKNEESLYPVLNMVHTSEVPAYLFLGKDKQSITKTMLTTFKKNIDELVAQIRSYEVDLSHRDKEFELRGIHQDAKDLMTQIEQLLDELLILQQRINNL